MKQQVDIAINHWLDVVDAMPDQVERAKLAEVLSGRMRDAMEEFGDQRSAALQTLRDEGWSLADMRGEFNIARQRLSQLINRETYKETRRNRGKT